MTDLNVLNVDTYQKIRASSVDRAYVCLFNKTPGRRFRPQWFFSVSVFFCFCFLLLFSFIIVILNYCKVDYKVIIIRNSKLMYLSRMKSCLWGWSCYHYSLAQRPILIDHMQVRNLRNRLRVSMVCEWAWVSIPGERHLPKSLNWGSRLELRSHVHYSVRTHARTHTGKRAHVLLITMVLKQKQK